MAEYLIQSETLDDIADAINAKTGGSSAMTPAEMVTAIGRISGGGTDRLKTAEVTLTQDYALAQSTSASVMALCASAIGTANYIVLQKSTTKTDDTDKKAMFYYSIAINALGTAVPLNKNLNMVSRTNADSINGNIQGTVGFSYNCKAWAGDVYQIWGWD